MRTWNNILICRMIEGAIASFSHAHPDRAIPRPAWHSIAKRAARTILNEHLRRFGTPVDRLVIAAVARRVERTLARARRESA